MDYLVPMSWLYLYPLNSRLVISLIKSLSKILSGIYLDLPKKIPWCWHNQSRWLLTSSVNRNIKVEIICFNRYCVMNKWLFEDLMHPFWRVSNTCGCFIFFSVQGITQFHVHYLSMWCHFPLLCKTEPAFDCN